MNQRRIMTLLLCACLGLSGCTLRTRVVPEAADTSDDQTGTGRSVAAEMSAQPGSDTADMAGAAPNENAPASSEPDPNAPTLHSDEAERRTFAEHVSAALDEGASRQATLTTADEALPAQPQEGGTVPYDRQQTSAELTLTERKPLAEADELAAADEGRVADSVLQYYQTLLMTKANTLFECQRLYVYWETAQDHVTVHKTSVVHTVITLAGGYDVAAKRQEDALLVDDGWISRKDPGCVVKVLPRDTTESEAQTIRAALRARPEWGSITAVKNDSILLLNERLLDTPAGQTAAALLLAAAMYPQAYADLDEAAALAELMAADGAAWLYTR